MTIGRVLIVEDEAPIRKVLRVALEAHGFDIVESPTGRDGIAKAATASPDLVILDLGLPDFDGKDVVKAIREWSTLPILVLSVRETELEKVAALDAGANDYVVKPFGMAELLARVRALLRSVANSAADQPAQLHHGDLAVDLVQHVVTLAGNPIRLSRKEFDLLALLMRHAGRLVTHRQLLRQIWGPAHEDDAQYLRVFIGRLRHKLGDDPARPRYIMNEPGVGYRFLVD